MIFRCEFEGELASKKSSMVIRRFGNRLSIGQNAKVQRVQKQLERAIAIAIAQQQLATPTFPSDSVELRVEIDKLQQVTRIAVVPIAPRPKGVSGRKRDMQNELALICDSLEKAGVVSNDNQVARIVAMRIVDGVVR